MFVDSDSLLTAWVGAPKSSESDSLLVDSESLPAAWVGAAKSSESDSLFVDSDSLETAWVGAPKSSESDSLLESDILFLEIDSLLASVFKTADFSELSPGQAESLASPLVTLARVCLESSMEESRVKMSSSLSLSSTTLTSEISSFYSSTVNKVRNRI